MYLGLGSHQCKPEPIIECILVVTKPRCFNAKEDQDRVVSAKQSYSLIALSKKYDIISCLNVEINAYANQISNDINFLDLFQSTISHALIKFSLNKKDDFFTKRRFIKRSLTNSSINEIII